MTDRMNEREFEESQGSQDWRAAAGSAKAYFVTGSFSAGAELVSAVAKVADELNHHPDADVRFGGVRFTLTSHDVGGLTSRDVELARRISELASQRGFVPDASDAG